MARAESTDRRRLAARDFLKAEESLRRLAHIVKQDLGLDLKNAPGGGAAGGLGFGLAAFLGARLDPGFHLFAREARLATKLRGADLVITGEGRLDESTAMGKSVGRTCAAYPPMGIPCIGLTVKLSRARTQNFVKTAGITDLTNVQMAKSGLTLALPTAHALAGRWVAKSFELQTPVNVWRMNLEDHLGDVIGKARAMTNVSPATPRAAGLTEHHWQPSRFRAGPGQPNFDACRQILHLNPTKLRRLAAGWKPVEKDLSVWRELRCITSMAQQITVNFTLLDEVSREPHCSTPAGMPIRF